MERRGINMDKLEKEKETLIRRYNFYIEEYESEITFENFLILHILSQKDEIDSLMQELIKLNPPWMEEIDEIAEEFFDTLKKEDKEAEEKFKRDYQ
tara:strand:+ start:1659 stop:1946 length:288 start_codon:yes stop_codon:yes gene_type:complete